MVAYPTLSYLLEAYTGAFRFNEHFINHNNTIDRFTLCVLFHFTMFAYISVCACIVISLCTYTNVMVVIDILVVVDSKEQENRVNLSCHD